MNRMIENRRSLSSKGFLLQKGFLLSNTNYQIHKMNLLNERKQRHEMVKPCLNDTIETLLYRARENQYTFSVINT